AMEPHGHLPFSLGSLGPARLRRSVREKQETHKLQHVPVEDVVVGEALPVEKVPEELPQVRVVGLVVEPQRATKVQVGRELGWRRQEGMMRISRTNRFKMTHFSSDVPLTGVSFAEHLNREEEVKAVMKMSLGQGTRRNEENRHD
uniref:Uncharacterized protein n=1 Tax=Poecilia latipinna TaxID=48699 RepID=A0A3B3TJT8_9TELE